jgi:hypothetical protein
MRIMPASAYAACWKPRSAALLEPDAAAIGTGERPASAIFSTERLCGFNLFRLRKSPSLPKKKD